MTLCIMVKSCTIKAAGAIINDVAIEVKRVLEGVTCTQTSRDIICNEEAAHV